MSKMVRKQFFITSDQNRRLRTRAAAAGVSEAELIRDGIELRLDRGPEAEDWRNGLDKLSGAWAERGNLEEEMREIRRSWNRRRQILDRKPKRS